MVEAFLVALAVFICVGGAELAGFTMLNRPIVIGPLVGLFLGDLSTGVTVGAALEAVFMGVVNIGGASAAEPGIATAVGTAFAIMMGKGSEVALTLALPIGIEISYIPKDLITVIFYYQISLNPLKTQSLSQVSFPLLFPLRYIVPPVFTNSDKGKNKGKKII